MKSLIAPPPARAIASIIGFMTYGTCDTIALVLRKELRHRGSIKNGYVLQAGLQNGPNTILVPASFHELKATPKSGKIRISILSWNLVPRQSIYAISPIKSVLNKSVTSEREH